MAPPKKKKPEPKKGKAEKPKKEKPKPKPKPKGANKPKPPPKRKPPSNVKELLATVGVTDPVADFAGCASLDDEFAVVRRAWHKSILASHPDKGGDRELFELIQSAFDTLKDMKTNEEVDSFAVAAKVSVTRFIFQLFFPYFVTFLFSFFCFSPFTV